jgi:sulfur-oxidizing protein SoxZ
MPGPSRIRAIAQGGQTVVRVLMSHDMETGMRSDATGKLVPAWHITQVLVQLGGRTVLTAHTGIAVSKDPFLQFTLEGAKPGDTVRVSWVDSKGERRSDESVVIAG